MNDMPDQLRVLLGISDPEAIVEIPQPDGTMKRIRVADMGDADTEAHTQHMAALAAAELLKRIFAQGDTR